MSELFDKETGEILPDDVTTAFGIYMAEAAKQEHWVKHRRLIKPWRVSIKERMDEHEGIASWREAITIAARSDFLSGRIIGARGRFQLDINFLVQPRSFAKILDGFYTREQGPLTQKLTLPTMQPPHLKPAEPFKYDIEAPEERMAFTVTRLRAAGQYARANEWEEKLAALQKRPAVLVPAPEVAFTSGAAPPQQRSGSAYPPPPLAPRQPAQGPVSEPEWEMVPE